MPKPFKVFISYSHNDMFLRKELDKHLTELRNANIISVWTDSEIRPGTEWETQIREQLNSAEIILLLISSDFMASAFCRSIEMVEAMERHKSDTARVIPIILRSVLWEISPFGKLQALPLTPDKRPLPVTSWPLRDDAFTNIARGIMDIAEELEQKEKKGS